MVASLVVSVLSLFVLGCGSDSGGGGELPHVTPTTVPATPSPRPTGDAVAWAAGDVIVRSDDGGLDWDVVRPAGGFTSVSFADRDSGWAVAPKTILHSVDGGETWIEQTGAVDINVIRTFNDVVALDVTTAVIAAGILPAGSLLGEGPVNVRRTTDGGVTWSSARLASGLSRGELRQVCFTETGIGFACGRMFFGAFCALSDDGGRSWFRTAEARGSRLACAGEATLWNVSNLRDLHQSTDGGLSFENRGGTLPDAFRGTVGGIAFADEMLGWLVGRDEADRPTILHTTDGGKTWVPQVLPGDAVGRLRAVQFADPRRGVAVGERTDLAGEATALGFSTTDGGAVWQAARFPVGTPPLRGLTVVR